MSNVKKRLDSLERAARPRKQAYAVLYQDPDQGDIYWEHNPFGADRGRQYTESDKAQLASEVQALLIVQYEIGAKEQR